MRVCEYQREVKTVEPYQVLELEREDWDAVGYAIYCGSASVTLKGAERQKAWAVYAALCKLRGFEPTLWKM